MGLEEASLRQEARRASAFRLETFNLFFFPALPPCHRDYPALFQGSPSNLGATHAPSAGFSDSLRPIRPNLAAVRQ